MVLCVKLMMDDDGWGGTYRVAEFPSRLWSHPVSPSSLDTLEKTNRMKG